MNAAAEDLRALLIGAAESPAERRDEWLERIAAHGAQAVEQLAGWIYDADLAPFAMRAIARAAELGAAEAAASALGEVRQRQLDPDRFEALVRTIDHIKAVPAPEGSSPGDRRPVQRLVAGQLYRRRELHASGLGGNRQKGISYPARGTHALLFSGGTGRSDYGYHDGPEGEYFRYFGEWSGSGDMTMTGGNRVIRDRSPQLYLFLGRGEGLYRFEGQFEYVSHRIQPAVRDGRESAAIVFRLRKVATEVEL